MTPHDRPSVADRPRPRPADVLLLGFARALRAAGLPVTADRAQTFLDAVGPVGLADRRGHLLGRAGDALRRARRTSSATTRSSTAWFLADDGQPRGRPATGARGRHRRRRSSRRGRRRARGPRSRGRCGSRRARPRCCATATSPPSTPAERARLNRLFAALRPVAPRRTSYRRTPARRGAVDASRDAAPRRCAGWGSRSSIAWRRRVHAAPPRRAAGRRVGLDERLRRRAAAPRATASRRAVREPATRRSSASAPDVTRLTRAMRLRDADRALVAAGETVPDWSGGTRLGERLRVFLDRWGQRGLAAVRSWWSSATAGSAATRRCWASRWAGCAGSRTGWCGSTRTGARPATSPCSRGWRRRCRTSTTSSPATRWRRSSEVLEVIARA